MNGLCFTAETDFLERSAWDALRSCALASYWLVKDGKKMQTWVFPIEALTRVETIVGIKTEFSPAALRLLANEKPALFKAAGLRRNAGAEAESIDDKEPKRIVIEEVNIPGWRGRSGAEIDDYIEVYQVTEHRRHKNTGEIVKSVHYIPRRNVEVIWKIITDAVPFRGTMSYHDLVTALIRHYHLEKEVDLDSWAGGKNRAKYFFPLHYYCIKILEDQGKVYYEDRGAVLRAQ